MIELRLLGALDVSGLDEARTRALLGQPKRLALLAYLLLARPRGAHARDRLLGIFWPEQDDASARNALGQALHFLRDQLGHGAIVNRGRSAVAVDTARVTSDVHALEAAIDSGDAARALELGAHELMPGFHISGAPEFERWLDDERSGLGRAVLRCAWQEVEAREAAGDAPGAARIARDAAQMAPADQKTLRRAMTALDRAGDAVGALAMYDSAMHRLRSEYELDPEPATLELAESIRARARAEAHAPVPPASVAVLPFLDLSPARDQAFLGDGLAEELIAALAAIPALHVTSRTSTFALRDRSMSLRDIARELRVATVLEGSIRRAGDRIRITAQLIDAATDAHLWAETYDREISDVLEVQAEIGERIADALSVVITASERRRVAVRATQNVDAYQNYLRGRYLCQQSTAEAWHRGVEFYDRAIAEEPLFAHAHAARADAHLQLPLFHFAPPMPRPAARARAKAAALRALELNDELAEAHAALGWVLWHEWQWDDAMRSLDRAVALSPGSAPAHHRRGLCLIIRRRYAEGEAELRRALELDPLSMIIQVDLAVSHLRQRRFDEAEARLEQVLQLDPEYVPALHYMAEVGAFTGRPAMAANIALRRGFFSQEQTDYFMNLLREDPRAAHRHRVTMFESINASPCIVATAYAMSGDFDTAFSLLQRALDEHDVALTNGVRDHPGFDIFRHDPRFDAILERMNIPREEALQATES